jgi:hypothetical protein
MSNLLPITNTPDSNTTDPISHAEKSSATKSMAMLLGSPTAAEEFVTGLTAYEISVAPIAAFEMLDDLHRKVESVIRSLHYIDTPPIDDVVEWVHQAINSDTLNTFEHVSPSSVDTTISPIYFAAVNTYNNDKARAKAAMPRIMISIIANPGFKAKIRFFVAQGLAIIENANEKIKNLSRDSYVNFAVSNANDQRAKRLERSIIDVKSLSPAEQSLINQLDFNIDQMSLFTDKLDVVDLNLLPLVAEHVSNRINSWLKTFLVNDYNIERLVLGWGVSKHLEAIKYCQNEFPVNKLADMSMFDGVTPEILQQKSSKLLKDLVNSDGIRHELRVRSASQYNKLNAQLPANDTNRVPTYEVEIEQALTENLKLALVSGYQHDISAKAEKSLTTLQERHADKSHSSAFSYLMVGVPVLTLTVLCAYTLYQARKESLSNMGSSWINAAKYGITFLSGRRPNVDYLPITNDAGSTSEPENGGMIPGRR